MNQPNDEIAKGVKSIYPPLCLSILVGWLIYWSYDYGATARQLPLLVSKGLLVLIALDVVSRARFKIGALLHLALGAGFQDPEMKHTPDWRAESMQFAWVAACVIAMALIGILPTIPAFIFLYMVLQGRQPILFSLLVAGLIVCMVGVTFEIFLEYDLYRGILLNNSNFE